MKNTPTSRFHHELATIMVAELDDTMHLEALRQAKLRAGFAGVSRETRDDIQQLLVEQLLG
jgi:hypothetical protein